MQRKKKISNFEEILVICTVKGSELHKEMKNLAFTYLTQNSIVKEKHEIPILLPLLLKNRHKFNRVLILNRAMFWK